MKILKISFFVILLLNLMGCDEDRFTAVKNIEFPEHESVLAITSHIGLSDQFTAPQAFVGHSLGILDQQDYTIINDATVELYKDGNLFYNLEPLNNNGSYFGPSGQDITPGTYTMKVSAPNYDPVEATQVLPSMATVLSATYEFEKVPFDFDSDLYDLMKLKIADPEDEENFYAFEMVFEIMDGNGNMREAFPYSDSDDPLFEYGYNVEHILPDISFNGKNYDVRLVQQSKWDVQQGETLIAVRVNVITLTKDYYTYEISRNLNYEAEDNPFAEPVLVHSNFEGGFGVFTLNNVTTYRHEF